MKNTNIIGLVTAGWLLGIGALNIDTSINETIFGLAPDFFKGILIGLSITANTMATIKYVKMSKKTCSNTE